MFAHETLPTTSWSYGVVAPFCPSLVTMKSGSERIRDATACVDKELSLVETEIEAWTSFREGLRLSRGATVQVAQGDRSESVGGTAAGDLRERYVETVMSSPHYDEQYGDTITESLEAEFGGTIADRLCSEGELGPRIRRNLLVATSDRIDEREEYVRLLRSERASLQESMAELEAVESRLESVHPPTDPSASLDTRIDAWNALEDLEARCERIATERQRFLDEVLRPNLGSEAIPFTAYLYRECGSRHPVLRGVATTLRRIEATRG